MSINKRRFLMPRASVKVMRSYDYCHFEVTLGTDEDMTLEEVDDMRKSAQRLADKAVKQYAIAKNMASNQSYEHGELERQVRVIKENYPQSEWTPEQQAKVKALADFRFYDYQDDWS